MTRLEEAISKLDETSGWFSKEDLIRISKLKLPKNLVILELGTHRGKFVKAMRTLYPKSDITTCDPLISPDLPTELNIKYLCENGLDLKWDKKIDLLFVDDNHQYDTVKGDIDKYKSYIKKGGYMVFHDYNGVGEIFNAVNEKLGAENIEICDDGEFSLAIWRNDAHSD